MIITMSPSLVERSKDYRNRIHRNFVERRGLRMVIVMASHAFTCSPSKIMEGEVSQSGLQSKQVARRSGLLYVKLDLLGSP